MLLIDQYKRNLKIAYPVALSQLGHMAVGVADSIMVGSLGGVALAGVTIGFSSFIPFMMLGIGISYGISPLIAKADGEKNPRDISSILKHAIVLNVLTGLILCLGLYASSPMLTYLKQPEEVISLAIPFFKIMAISMVPLMIFQVFRQFAEGLALTRQAMIISIIGNVINIILNYLLIHGKFGFPQLGVNGAAYATLISRVVIAVAMFAFVFYYPRFKSYWAMFKEIKWSLSIFSHLLKMSLPVGVQLTLEAGAFGFAAIMVGWLGAKEIAAHHIALNMAAITYMTATGIASAATVRIGHEFGKKDYFAMRKAGIAAFHLALVFMGCCALGFLAFRQYLPALYIADVDIGAMATSLLLISAFFQLSDGVQVVGLGALRGIGDIRIPTAIALISYWLLGLPLGYFMAFPMGYGVEGIWYGLFCGLTIAACLLYARFTRKSKRLIVGIKNR
ncbi:MAG: MATE family efflux transporter [Cytophagaceae bacterium]